RTWSSRSRATTRPLRSNAPDRQRVSGVADVLAEEGVDVDEDARPRVPDRDGLLRLPGPAARPDQVALLRSPLLEHGLRLRPPDLEVHVCVGLERDRRLAPLRQPDAVDVLGILARVEPGAERGAWAPRTCERRMAGPEEAVRLDEEDVLVRLLRIDRRGGRARSCRDVQHAEAGVLVPAGGADV